MLSSKPIHVGIFINCGVYIRFCLIFFPVLIYVVRLGFIFLVRLVIKVTKLCVLGFHCHPHASLRVAISVIHCKDNEFFSELLASSIVQRISLNQ